MSKTSAETIGTSEYFGVYRVLSSLVFQLLMTLVTHEVSSNNFAFVYQLQLSSVPLVAAPAKHTSRRLNAVQPTHH